MDAERAAGHVARPAARHPGDGQGQPRRRRPADHRGLRGAGEQRPGQGLAGRREAARRGRRPARQAEPVSEFANFLANGPCRRGYSSLGGQVLNPYNADITPSGSSSGSGARGRVRPGRDHDRHRDQRLDHVSPAAAQSDVGLRPTVGLVSRTGILPISATQDTAGPITRTVADAAAELGAIAGKDPEDPATDTAPATVPDYLAGLSPTRCRASGSASSPAPTRSTRRRSRSIQALGATTVTVATPERDEHSLDPQPGVQARPRGVLQPPARERADEDARGRHRLQQRARRRRR